MDAAEALTKMEVYKARSGVFEKKYRMVFESFKKKVETTPKEDFEKWDDLIEWDANHAAFLEWKKKYEDLL